MTWKDKLEIGLKDDAPFRKDNLPEFQVHSDTPETKPGDPTRSPEEPGARQEAEAVPPVTKTRRRTKRAARRPSRSTH
jgi:hypothetical protein